MKNGFKEMMETISIINKIPTLESKSDTIHRIWSKEHYPYSRRSLCYANKTIEGFPTEYKTPKNPEYDDIKISYTFDENGYRKYPNYISENNKKIYCFGCSNTFGTGLPDEYTWPLLLAKNFDNCQFKNFGAGGDSIDGIVRTAWQIISQTPKDEYPDSIYFLFPDFFRSEYIGNVGEKIIETSILPLTSWTAEEIYIQRELWDEKNFHLSPYSKFYSHYKYTSCIHSFFEFIENFKFIDEFLNGRNIKWYWYSWYNLMFQLNKKQLLTFFKDNTILCDSGLKIINKDSARDSRHLGYGYNKSLANEFYKLTINNI
jgi:hypothetical protein